MTKVFLCFIVHFQSTIVLIVHSFLETFNLLIGIYSYSRVVIVICNMLKIKDLLTKGEKHQYFKRTIININILIFFYAKYAITVNSQVLQNKMKKQTEKKSMCLVLFRIFVCVHG